MLRNLGTCEKYFICVKHTGAEALSSKLFLGGDISVDFFVLSYMY